MFSLVITIISIALVAALALATLYFGGAAFNKGRADAEASKIINQGQQLLGASELFYASHGRWPDNVPEMISLGYLKSGPVAGAALPAAWAAEAWEMPTAGVPVFVVDPINDDVCSRVNHKSYGMDGVLEKLYPGLMYQCWGGDLGALQTVVARATGDLALAFDAGSLESGAIPSRTEADKWSVLPPDETGAASEEPPSGSFKVAQIAAGSAYTCAITQTGGLKCWGQGLGGAFGAGTEADSPTPRDVAGVSTGVSLLAASSHACAVVSGTLKCWGDNHYGQVGGGTATPWASVATQDVVGLGAGVSALDLGVQHTCAVSGGNAYCWGKGTSWQLGQGAAADSAAPVAVSGLSGAPVQVAAADLHSCALLSSGTVECWGAGFGGLLGHGLNTSSAAPVAVVGVSGAASLAAGDYHSCVVTSSGGVKCWGNGSEGQLGNGATSNSNTPVDVVGLSGPVSSISAGGWQTCAVTDSGAVQCWGQGQNGKLGNGGAGNSATPVSVVGLRAAAVSVSMGANSACAVLVDASAQCWGYNGTGQLGTEVVGGASLSAVDVVATTE